MSRLWRHGFQVSSLLLLLLCAISGCLSREVPRILHEEKEEVGFKEQEKESQYLSQEQDKAGRPLEGGFDNGQMTVKRPEVQRSSIEALSLRGLEASRGALDSSDVGRLRDSEAASSSTRALVEGSHDAHKNGTKAGSSPPVPPSSFALSPNKTTSTALSPPPSTPPLTNSTNTSAEMPKSTPTLATPHGQNTPSPSLPPPPDKTSPDSASPPPQVSPPPVAANHGAKEGGAGHAADPPLNTQTSPPPPVDTGDEDAGDVTDEEVDAEADLPSPPPDHSETGEGAPDGVSSSSPPPVSSGSPSPPFGSAKGKEDTPPAGGDVDNTTTGAYDSPLPLDKGGDGSMGEEGWISTAMGYWSSGMGALAELLTPEGALLVVIGVPLMLLIALVVCVILKCRPQWARHGAGPKYQELEMGATNGNQLDLSTTFGQVDGNGERSRKTDPKAWDTEWDDDWDRDDEEETARRAAAAGTNGAKKTAAPLVLGKKGTSTTGSKTVVKTKPKAEDDGWEDWDD